MKYGKGIFCLGLCVFLLTGCSGRELEDREFPSVLTVPSEQLEALLQLRQQENSRYLDYSHTKAVIILEEVAEEEGKLRDTLLYLEERPEFARNMLVFVGGKKELKEALADQEKVGMELKDYFKNQPRELSLPMTTLKDLLNYIHNQEPEIEIPKVKAVEKGLMPEGSKKLTQGETKTPL